MLEVEMRYPFVTLIMPALFHSSWSPEKCGLKPHADHAASRHRGCRDESLKLKKPVHWSHWSDLQYLVFPEGKKHQFFCWLRQPMPPGIGGGAEAGPLVREIRGMSRCQVIWLGDLREGTHGAKSVCNWMFEKGKDKYWNNMEKNMDKYE